MRGGVGKGAPELEGEDAVGVARLGPPVPVRPPRPAPPRPESAPPRISPEPPQGRDASRPDAARGGGGGGGDGGLRRRAHSPAGEGGLEGLGGLVVEADLPGRPIKRANMPARRVPRPAATHGG